MPGNAFLSGAPQVALSGVVANPGNTQLPDSTGTMAMFGRNGQLYADELHGQYYSAASRGNLFVANTLVAGVTIPAPATTLASKAGLVNPIGSGVNMELVALGLWSITIDVALQNFTLEFQINSTTTGGVPTSVTKLTSYSQPLGAGNKTAQGYAYTAATMTNAAANPIRLNPFGDYLTAVGYVPTIFPLNGMVVMGPDTVMAITNIASIAAIQVAYFWAEWPV